MNATKDLSVKVVPPRKEAAAAREALVRLCASLILRRAGADAPPRPPLAAGRDAPEP